MPRPFASHPPLTRRCFMLGAAASAVPVAGLAANVRTAESTRLPAADSLGTAMARLGDHLLTSFMRETPNGNHMLSPWSVHAALGLLALGAQDKAWKALADLLGVPNGSHDALAKALRVSRRSLNVGPSVTLNRAEAAWVGMPLRFTPRWQALAETSLATRGRRLDFGSPTVLADLNGWVAKQTRGAITEILDRLPDGSRFVLASAIHFHGRWAEPFVATATALADFLNAVGETAHVPIMSRDATDTLYGQAGSGHAVILPYAGNSMVMAIATAHTRDAVPAFLSEIREKGVEAYLRSVRYGREPTVHVRLPRFAFDSKSDLMPALDRLTGGMLGVQGDFSGVTGTPAVVDQISHRAKVHVDEQGTEAAAATAVVATRSVQRDTPLFNADRPFAFLIGTWPRNRQGAFLPLFSGFVGNAADAQVSA